MFSIPVDSLLTGLGITLTILALFGSWFVTLVGMPGNWLIVGVAALYAWWVPDESRWDLSWQNVAVLAGLAVVGEVVEAGLSAAGVSRLGGSRRGMVLALLGSFVGAFMGAGMGLPIPLVGPLLGIMLGAGLGALGGAALGELWKGRTVGESLHIGHAAFWGRLIGSFAKLFVGTVMVTLAVAAIFVR